MNQISTLVLRVAVALIGLVILGLCIFVVPRGIATSNVDGYRVILLGLYVPAIPFFYALYQTFKLLHFIDKGKVFTKRAVGALQRIKFAAVAISSMFAAGMPYIFSVADQDDAPGVVALGLLIVFASFVIATAAAVFQQLLAKAVAIKSENDLTV